MLFFTGDCCFVWIEPCFVRMGLGFVRIAMSFVRIAISFVQIEPRFVRKRNPKRNVRNILSISLRNKGGKIMFTYKVDEEIGLKLVMPSDAQDVFNMIDRNREHLREWLGWVDISTDISVTYQMIDINLRKFANHEALDTAIVYNGKIVGKVSINSINLANKTAQIGYMLDEKYEGRGIVTRAVKAMIDIAMFEYDLHKVEIWAAEGNAKSRAIPERLGFVQEGMIRSAEWLYDHYIDHVVYGVLRREWLARK